MNRTKTPSASSKTVGVTATASAPAAPVRHQRHSSKRDDAAMLSLREELQSLYKSLQHKNDELIALERIILERDTTINGLTKDRQRLVSGAGANPTAKRNSGSGVGSASVPKSFTSNIERDRMAKQNEIASERSDSSFTAKTTSDAELIREQNEMIKELNEKVLRLSRNLNLVQRNLQEREERIVELQTEIDKFRQIVRPITQAMMVGQQQRKCNCMDEWNDCISGIGDWSPGIESTRVLPVKEPRIKRQAISAEPLSQLADINELDGLVRIPKSSL